MGGIYKIVNLKSGKVYVGQTNKSFHIRKKQHFRDLRLETHDNSYLQRAWKKYGEENFVFVPIETALIKNEEYLSKREQYWMDECKSLNREFGYNLREAFPVKKHSEETKRMLSEFQRGELAFNAKLTWEEVREIRKIYKTENFSQEELAIEYGVKRGCIKDVLENNTWKDSNYIPHKRNRFSKLNKSTIEEIKNKYKTGNFSYRKLGRKYGVWHKTIKAYIENG